MNIDLDQETKLFSVCVWLGVNNSSNEIIQHSGADSKMVCFVSEMHFMYKHIHVWYIMVPTFLTGMSVHSSNHWNIWV